MDGKKTEFLTTKLFIAFVVFSILLATSLLKHELWGDEIQAWALSRDAKSPIELFYNLRYEGNPGLWHSILFLTSKVTGNTEVIKLLNYCITLCAVYVFLRFSKFKTWQKILFIFGYFVFYEYGTISRHYALTVLLLFITCALYKVKFEKPQTFSISLVLLAMTSPYGTILSVAFLTPSVFEWLPRQKINKHSLSTIFLISLLGLFLAYTLSLPPLDGAYNLKRKYIDIKLAKETLSSVWNSFAPIPESKFVSWNTNIVGDYNISFYASLVLIILCLFLLRRSKAGIVYFLTALAGLFLFSYTSFSGALRHQGHVYLAFITALWISWEKLHEGQKKLERYLLEGFLLILFSTQIFSATYFFIKDYKYRFYYAVEAAKYIKQNGFESYYFIGDDDLGPIDITMYLNKPIFVAKINERRNFVLYNNERKVKIPNVENLISKAQNRYNDGNKNLLLLTTYKIDESKYPVVLVKEYNEGFALRRKLLIYKFVPIIPTISLDGI